MTSCRPSRRTSFPSLGGTTAALVGFAPVRDECTRRGPGVGNPVPPAGMLPRRRQDLLRSWGTPVCLCPALRPRPGRSHQAVTMGRCCPQWNQDEGPDDWNFRGWITQLQHSLSTLRSAGYPYTTQDSLRLLAKLYRREWLTSRVPTKGFSFGIPLHLHPPFPHFLAQGSSSLVLFRNRQVDASRAPP